jgi:hypothetical protein
VQHAGAVAVDIEILADDGAAARLVQPVDLRGDAWRADGEWKQQSSEQQAHVESLL